MNSYHPVTEKITTLLTERGVWFETFEHAPVRTSEEAAAMRPEYTISQGAKALIVKVKHRPTSLHSLHSDYVSRGGAVQKAFVQVVVPGDKRFDVKKLKTSFGFSDVRFATEAEVDSITGGVLPGGVPPFGNLFGLAVYADEGIFVNEKIIFNAGDRAYSVGMFSRDYDAIVSPQKGDICV